MGQQNDKVYIQQINSSDVSRKKNRRIFGHEYEVKQLNRTEEHCERPFCNCSRPHIRKQNMKICSMCGSSSGPALRKNGKLMYEASRVRKEPVGDNFDFGQYHDRNTVEKSQPIYYYNGWSLPTQKCYAEKIERSLEMMKQTNRTEEIQQDNMEFANEQVNQSMHKYEDYEEEEVPYHQEQYVKRQSIGTEKQKPPSFMHENVAVASPIRYEVPRPTINYENIEMNNRVNNLFLI